MSIFWEATHVWQENMLLKSLLLRLPWQANGEDSVFPPEKAQVWSLVEELKSHKLYGKEREGEESWEDGRGRMESIWDDEYLLNVWHDYQIITLYTLNLYSVVCQL